MVVIVKTTVKVVRNEGVESVVSAVSSYVLTIDQVASRKDGDRVPFLLCELEEFNFVVPPSRTLGDEIQGVTNSPEVVVNAVRQVLRDNNWHIGLGIGPVSPDEQKLTRSAEAVGPTFVLAREAVEVAKRKPGRSQVAVRSEDETPRATEIEALFDLLAGVISQRSASHWRVIDAANREPDATQAQLAEHLDLTQQGVAKSLASALWRQEQGVLPLLTRLVKECGMANTTQ